MGIAAPSRDRASWLAAVGLAAFAVALRWPGLKDGYTGDEIANLTPAGAWDIVFATESGVNPPLLRLLFNTLFEGPAVIDWGRRLSLVCSALAMLWTFKLGELAAGGRLLGGIVAAFFVATTPWAVIEATTFRSYSPWLMFMSWHVYSALRFEQEPTDRQRPWGLQLAATAVVLPWLHYVSIPLLLCLGSLDRRRFRWYLPGACAALPLLFLIATLTGDRVPAGLSQEALQRSLAIALGGEGSEHVMRLVLPLVVIVGAKERQRSVLLLGVGALAVDLSALLLSLGHFVRPPGAIWSLPFLGGLLGSVAGLRPRWAGLVVCAGIVAWLATDTLPLLKPGAMPTACRNEARQAAHELHAFDASRRDRPIWVSPSFHRWSILITLTNMAPSESDTNTALRCSHGRRDCFRVEDVDVAALDMARSTPIPDGIVFHLELLPHEALSSRCRVLRAAPCQHVYDCGAPGR